ncbi:MAG: ribose 5-phosphate isomerase B [Deltaproteobacteria bacterium]|nr:ribose 5-phosphate isomerase B [Deltaproteobacteria bacterium]
MKWYVGSDHAGVMLKKSLVENLRALGDEVADFGPDNGDEVVDYPDYGEKVARAVAERGDGLGLLVCGTGIGISIAANKIPGVRAARVTDTYSARLAREHNDANVLCLGERVTGPGVAEDIVRIFRDTPFAGGRHKRRIDKIAALDKR